MILTFLPLIGYKPPGRNMIVKNLKPLHQVHTLQTKAKFEEANFLSITCDFWKNRQQKSFLVITGHYVDAKFDQHSKVLSFMTFESRHFSQLIAQEIEKTLIAYDLYDKLVTITCDGASNMREMFNYFSRRNIKYIHCIAHKLHLVICNGLNLWVSPKKKQNTSNIEEAAKGSSDDDDQQEDESSILSQMVRTMSVDIGLIVNDDNDEDHGINDTSKLRHYLCFV
jgi:hypothetical protein